MDDIPVEVLREILNFVPLPSRVCFALMARRFLLFLPKDTKGVDLIIQIVTSGSKSQLIWALEDLKARANWYYQLFEISRFPPSKDIAYFLKSYLVDGQVDVPNPSASSITLPFFLLGQVIDLEEARNFSSYFESPLPRKERDHSFRTEPAIYLMGGACFQGNDVVLSYFFSLMSEIPYEVANRLLTRCVPFDRRSCFELLMAKMENDFSFEKDVKHLVNPSSSIDGTFILTYVFERLLESSMGYRGYPEETQNDYVLSPLMRLFENPRFERFQFLLEREDVMAHPFYDNILCHFIKTVFFVQPFAYQGYLERYSTLGFFAMQKAGSRLSSTQIESLFLKKGKVHPNLLDSFWSSLLLPRIFTETGSGAKGFATFALSSKDQQLIDLLLTKGFGQMLAEANNGLPPPSIPVAVRSAEDENGDDLDTFSLFS